jgi:isoamylase
MIGYELKHRTTKTVEKGAFSPQGATLAPGGVNFALYSKHASEVFLLLFDAPGSDPSDIIRRRDCTKHVWHGF